MLSYMTHFIFTIVLRRPLFMLSHFSPVRLFVILWTIDRQAPLPIGFSRQEYWSWLPCPPPGDLPNPAIEPRSPALLADSLPSEPPGKPNFCLFNRKDVNLYNSCCFWGCNELKTFEQQSGNVNQPFHKIYQNTKHSFSKSFYFWKWILNEILHI